MSVLVLPEDKNVYCLRSSGVRVLNGLQKRRDVGLSRRKSHSRKNSTELPV